MSIYFFYGDEDYNIELEINKLKSKILDKNFASMNYKSIQNPSFADLISLMRTQPMMFGNQMIVIHCGDYFSKALEDFQITEIESALKDNSENLCIVFVNVLPRNEGKKVDSRKKFYKLLSKYAQCQEFPTFKTYNIKEISAWIKKIAKKQDVSIDDEACVALIEQVGNNLREIVKEIEKLKLFAHPEKNIKKSMVREISISNEDLFVFADYLLKGDKGFALNEFRKLLDKKHPLEILSAIHTMLRKWITIKINNINGVSNFEISKLVGQHEFVVKTSLEKMKNTPLKSLVELKQNLIKTEYKIKSGKANNPIDEVEFALF